MSDGHAEEPRRDFLIIAAAAAGGVGAAAMVWPFVDQMNPSADVLALSTTEVDLSAMQPGQTITVTWQKKPVFIRRRTAEELATEQGVDLGSLPDPEADSDRVKEGHEEFLVVLAACTHLGCIPKSDQGDYDGWFCPCHGSHYDASGRIRRGPAPANLVVPPYEFTSDTQILIG
ncbi:MAG: ubiquinol-cytochrome c reductase iron-sulfur subunit [Minwuia sp.]|uniref:ubiquinol-cytochrome c reductase iron-sulfur subunit n=1 Tax=Minwuia sp. TaxID=2493630 RepID=UPI003A844443